MLRQSETPIAPVPSRHGHQTKKKHTGVWKRDKKLADMQMKRVVLTDRTGRMFGRGCQTLALNELVAAAEWNCCFLSIPIKTDEADFRGCGSAIYAESLTGSVQPKCAEN